MIRPRIERGEGSRAVTSAEFRAYRAALARSHRTRFEIDVLDQNEDHIGSLTAVRGVVVSGQVDVDAEQVPTRTLSLTCLDPHDRLAFDAASPARAALFAHRFLAVRRGIYVPELEHWVDVPLFWGPVTGYDREGDVVTVTAGGKEVLYSGDYRHWLHNRSWDRGTKVTTVLRTIMSDMGETRFDFPEIERKLPHEISITRHEEVWPVLERLAASVNRQLYFDGLGRAKLRIHPQHPVVTFSDGHGALLLSAPKVSFANEFHNAVEVLGPEPEGKGKDRAKRIRGWWAAPPSHPLSPASLARNGEPVYRILSLGIDVPPRPDKDASKKRKEHYHHVLVEKQREADEIAQRRGLEEIRLASEMTFECLPVYDIEERDPYAVRRQGEHREGLARRYTIPLDSQSAMTVGATRRVDARKRTRREGSRHRTSRSA